MSCSDPDYEDLGNGYWKISEAEAIDVGLASGSIVFKSINNKKNLIDSIIVSENVIKCSFNENYIAVLKENHKLRNNKLEYFIVKKSTGFVSGPLNKIDFEKMKKSSNIVLEL
jgi:hypothetical protein